MIIFFGQATRRLGMRFDSAIVVAEISHDGDILGCERKMESIWADDDAGSRSPTRSTNDSVFPTGGGSGSISPVSSDSGSESETRSARLPRDEIDYLPKGLRTVGDAYQLCEELVHKQLLLAKERNPNANVSLPGDAASRAAFLLLLPDQLQRELFSKTARDPTSWPRIRTLFGAPPFHFLMPEDAGMLRAAGFARNRTNMTYETAGRAASSAQFGAGQLVDGALREYRVAAQGSAQKDDPLPSKELFLKAGTGAVTLQVKVPKRSLKDKRELMHSIDKHRLFFPQVGETIELQETKRMLQIRKLRQPSKVCVLVKALAPRSQGAQTASLLVTVV